MSRKYTHTERVAAFLSKIEIKSENGCWMWKAAIYNNGYGVFNRGGKLVAASRFMWELSNGCEIPKDMQVLHRCDVPLCVNPRHLWLGTIRDNMQDCVAKGRNWRGGNKRRQPIEQTNSK